MSGVKSPLTDFMTHLEVSMWAEGVDPETAQRVLNRVMFGHPAGASQAVLLKAGDDEARAQALLRAARGMPS
jgi:hypothetical protein